MNPPPEDIRGSFRNMQDDARTQRRVDWVRQALDDGLNYKEIAALLGISANSVGCLVRNNDLQRRRISRQVPLSTKLRWARWNLGKVNVANLLDALPASAQNRIIHRAGKSRRSIAQVFADDLAMLYNEQRRG